MQKVSALTYSLSSPALAIGLDIGGTNTKSGVVHSDGTLLREVSFATAQDPQQFLRDLKGHVQEHLDWIQTQKALNLYPLLGVGIGAPNANFQSQRVEHPVNLNWGTLPLVDWFAQNFQLKSILDNDANVGLLGEALFGAAQGVEDVLYMALGTGVGTGIMAQGELIRSLHGKAGEGGHLVVEKNGRWCGCGGKGHLEAYASARGVLQTYFELTQIRLEMPELSKKILSQELEAMVCLDRTAEKIAFALSQMTTLLNPSLIVLAGGVSQLAPHFLAAIEQWLNHYTFPLIKGDAQLVRAKAHPQSGAVVGAAALAFKSL
jgi:glucokinase